MMNTIRQLAAWLLSAALTSAFAQAPDSAAAAASAATSAAASAKTAAAAASAAEATVKSLASDESRLAGDHLRFATNVRGLAPIPAEASAKTYCAPKGSRAAIKEESGGFVSLRFLRVPTAADYLVDEQAIKACVAGDVVNTYTQYRIARSDLDVYEYKRSGVSFGGLVVPFKYRLGSAKELISSSTVAPYLGFRTAWFQDFGLTFTPVIATGLSLVPVADTAGKTTSAKTAYTLAFGVRLTSSKNENYSAGFLFGRDFVNATDRGSDPNTKKPWLSFYVGYAI